jgi:hypothetical protein
MVVWLMMTTSEQHFVVLKERNAQGKQKMRPLEMQERFFQTCGTRGRGRGKV